MKVIKVIRRLSLYSSILIGGILMSTSASATSTGIDMSKRPYVQLIFNVAGCLAKASVNDVPILDSLDGGSSGGAENTLAPINQWLRSGKNELTVEITPVDNMKATVKAGITCKVEVGFRISELPLNSKKLQPPFFYFGNLVYHARADKVLEGSEGKSMAWGHLSSKEGFLEYEKGDIVVGDIKKEEIEGKYGKGIKLTRTIEMPLPFPEWKWFRSDIIPNNEETKKELIEEYLIIWKALRDKDPGRLRDMPFWKKDEQEMPEAFYTTVADMDIIPELKELAHDPKVELCDFGAPVMPQYAFLHIFGNGRLAKLTIWDGSPAIYFNYKDGSGASMYDFVFRKKNGQWILTR